MAATVMITPEPTGAGSCKTPHGLEGDGPAGEDQQQGVAQGRQHRRLAEAVGAPPARRPVRPAPRQPGRAARHGQAQDIRQIMPGVGQQGGRIRDQARAELAEHEGQIDHQADGVAPVAGVHRSMGVTHARGDGGDCAMRMPMAVIIMIVPMIGGWSCSCEAFMARLYAFCDNGQAGT
jgi:hypothetical protein